MLKTFLSALVLMLPLTASAASVTYDLYLPNTQTLYAEFTAPDFLPALSPTGQVGVTLYSTDTRYCMSCDRAIIGDRFVFSGIQLGVTGISAYYRDVLPNGGTPDQYFISISSSTPIPYGQIGTYVYQGGTLSVSQRNDAVTYAPEPSTFALLGLAVVPFAWMRRKITAS